METSLKTGFAQVFSCCPKNLSCPNFGGAAAPLAPPARTPMLAPETVKVISLDQPVLMLHAHRAIAFNVRKLLRTHPLPFLLSRLPQNNMGPTCTPEEFSEN